jgi:pyruvate formate lyase activating enzyme
VANARLAEILDRQTAAGALCRVENERVRCLACGHYCLIGEGRRGICKVRFNQGGQLRVPFGYVAGLQCDPVEKKPFYHVYPGANALTFGMLGCDFHCGYCQNWVSSQALRDEVALAPVQAATPAKLVASARTCGARLLVSSYNEPLITAEWAAAVFAAAREAGLQCAFVSNGNATPETLDLLKPFLTAYKIDLKGFDDRRYRQLGGTLKNVQRGIEMVLERGLWLEVVTLLVPGFNDSEEELRQLTRFLAAQSRDIPWHVTAFHADYKMSSVATTRVSQLVRAAEIGLEEGLRFVYAGNAPGRVGSLENTRCPKCQTVVVERCGWQIESYRLTQTGRCSACGTEVPGVWSERATPSGPRQPRPERMT